jgi:hypothetical protein
VEGEDFGEYLVGGESKSASVPCDFLGSVDTVTSFFAGLWT